MDRKHETLSIKSNVMVELRERVAKSHRTLSGEIQYLMEVALKYEH